MPLNGERYTKSTKKKFSNFLLCLLCLALCFLCRVPDSFGKAQQPPQRTRSPHGALEIPCQNCHASESWKPIRRAPDFDHNRQTRYPLLGQHQTVSCTSCHVQLVFTNVAENCASCHADIHRRQFGASCENCHTVKGWRVEIDAVQHHANRFPLVGAHSVATCESCHRGAASGVFTGLSTTCVSCHAPQFESARTVDHKKAGFSTNCETCHTLSRWQAAKFDHSTATRFRLMGAHATVQCASCHVGGAFQGTSSDCFSCHAADFNRTTNPNHRATGFPTTCQTCHTDKDWRGAQFDHNLSRFLLTGAHTAVACERCHAGSRFTGTPQACVSCHAPQFAAATAPNHLAAAFSQECASCHTTSAWGGAQFDHNRTRFALTGAHTTATCSKCHVGNQFAGTSQTCISCHSQQFAATTAPNHAAAGFSQDCSTCHTTAAWRGGAAGAPAFSHAQTRFPLTGAHTAVACASCHVNNVFAGTSMDCYACHARNFAAAQSPNHTAAGFPTTCASCHTTDKWLGAKFDHNARTRFALTGAHVSGLCVQCHAGNRFAGTPQDCGSCHAQNFVATRNPNHATAGFPTTCASCHTTDKWLGAKFDHNTTTRFPLMGAHVTTACSACHVGGRFAGTPQTCVGCHTSAFSNTKNPNHAAAGFPQDCTLCHSTTVWTGARFDHNTKTRFPLTGLHVAVSCVQCHAGNQFAGTPQVCSSCHNTVFDRTTNPNHAAAGFTRDCASCHATSGWKPASFDHSRTRFPLMGAHASVTCASCHSSGQFATLNTTCVSCHLSKFTAATNPNHVTAAFPQDCQLCHTTTQWKGATFDHSKTRFALTGVHITTQCASCHIGGRYAGTPTDCYSCHSREFTTVTNPNHVSAGFPKTCATCHTTVTWTGAQFTHKFPIYSGAHSGKWSTCNDCHTNSSNYTVFTCLSCHAHDRTIMDTKHRSIRGYLYDSITCYGCHPNGKN